MNEQDFKYQKAKERVEALRGFYVHLTVYVIVNTGLFLIDLITTPGSFWFFWPLMGWGVGLFFHALSVFGFGSRLGANWEERKIREIMEKE
jgi:hypothetical protein